MNLAKSEYVYLLDDDNTFGEKFFKKSIREYKYEALLREVRVTQKKVALSHEKADLLEEWIKGNIEEEDYKEAKNIINEQRTSLVPREILYSPMVGRRETDRIQSVGIRRFHYLLGWPEPVLGGWKAKLIGGIYNLFCKNQEDKYFYYPTMIGGNSLFGKKRYFKELKFDERMKFAFEDLDLTHRWYRTIGDIVVSKNNIIHHMERDKTKAEQSFIGAPEGVYEKTKNRILFVKSNAKLWQKILFLGVGLWINTIWFFLFILFTGRQKGKLWN